MMKSADYRGKVELESNFYMEPARTAKTILRISPPV